MSSTAPSTAKAIRVAIYEVGCAFIALFAADQAARFAPGDSPSFTSLCRCRRLHLVGGRTLQRPKITLVHRKAAGRGRVVGVPFPLYPSGMTRRRFPPPWTVEEIPGGFKVSDANGQSLAYCYGRETQADADIAKVLTLDNARRIASNIAKLPELLGAASDSRRVWLIGCRRLPCVYINKQSLL